MICFDLHFDQGLSKTEYLINTEARFRIYFFDLFPPVQEQTKKGIWVESGSFIQPTLLAAGIVRPWVVQRLAQ